MGSVLALSTEAIQYNCTRFYRENPEQSIGFCRILPTRWAHRCTASAPGMNSFSESI